MSTDRELLELAAKAARYIIESHTIDGVWVYPNGSEQNNNGEWPTFLWRPEHDDGDALRLAVKLGLRLTLPKYHRFGTTAEPQVETTPGHTVFRDDPMQQTREAIVNTAAEIGRSMP